MTRYVRLWPGAASGHADLNGWYRIAVVGSVRLNGNTA
jgi:hypothetical protein